MKTSPRKVPTRDEFYMGKAFIVAGKSKDPSTQIGACIVSKCNRPLGTGYNGPPSDMEDEEIDWTRPHKYPYIVHAEDNAIEHTNERNLLPGATIYVTAAPCRACMLDIAKVKIKRVVYFRPKADAGSLLSNNEEWAITQDIARRSKVEMCLFEGKVNWIKDRILYMESIGVIDI
jgi:dCMP deaminase